MPVWNWPAPRVVPKVERYLFFIITSTLLFSLLLSSSASLIELDFVFQRAILAPDGQNKSTITINGQFPGPPIRANVGDWISVNVTNMLNPDETMSLHFHGIFQYMTPWADGTAMVTNCPLAYGASFTHYFQVTLSGSYWYHLHDMSQRGEGGYGFLIVEDQVPIAVYNQELLVIIADWYQEPYQMIDATLQQFGEPGQHSWPSTGNAILVNGVGGQYAAYLDVQPNQIYRVRLLNAGSLGYYNLAIAGHNLTVICAGTTPTIPVSMASIDIAVAERYDFLLSTNHAAKMYQINIQSNYQGTDDGPAGVYNNVYLRYSNSKTLSNTKPVNQTKPCFEQLDQLKASSSNNAIPAVTKEIIFNITREFTTPTQLQAQGTNTQGYYRWTINDLSFTYPSTPQLLASYYNLMNAVDYTMATSAIRIEYNEVVQIVLQNRAMISGECDQHPWHLHGNHFWVVGYGAGEYDPVTDPQNFNLVNPISVDTVVNYPTSFTALRNGPQFDSLTANNSFKPCGWTAVRFVANNPGFWHMHCHIEWDMTTGMGVLFDIASEMLWTNMSLRLPRDFGLCGMINANTPNPYAQPATPVAPANSQQQCSGLVISKTTLTLSLLFSILVSLLLGAMGCYIAMIHGLLPRSWGVSSKSSAGSRQNGDQTGLRMTELGQSSPMHARDDNAFNINSGFRTADSSSHPLTTSPMYDANNSNSTSSRSNI